MLSEVPIVKRVKVKPAGSATAGVNVSFFLFKLPEPDKSSKCNTQDLNFFGRGAFATVSGDTHTSHTLACNQLPRAGSTCAWSFLYIVGAMRTDTGVGGFVAAPASS